MSACVPRAACVRVCASVYVRACTLKYIKHSPLHISDPHPTHTQVLAANIVALAWNTYMSYKGHAEVEDA